MRYKDKSEDITITVTTQYLAIIVAHAGVHRDKDGAAGVEGELDPLKHELFDVVSHGVLDGVDLLSHYGEDSQLNSEYKYLIFTDQQSILLCKTDGN